MPSSLNACPDADGIAHAFDAHAVEIPVNGDRRVDFVMSVYPYNVEGGPRWRRVEVSGHYGGNVRQRCRGGPQARARRAGGSRRLTAGSLPVPLRRQRAPEAHAPDDSPAAARGVKHSASFPPGDKGLIPMRFEVRISECFTI